MFKFSKKDKNTKAPKPPQPGMLSYDRGRLKLKIPQVPSYGVLYKIHEFSKRPDYSALSYSTFIKSRVVCYSGIFRKLARSPKGANYITSLFIARPMTGADGVEFSEKHVERWVELCIKYKLLPPAFLFDYSVKRIKARIKGEDVDKLQLEATMQIEGVIQPTMYMWLDSFRHLREDQGFVMAVLYLHDELGIDFYASYILAGYDNVTNTGHHILQLARYSIYDAPKTTASRPEEYDPHECIDLKFAVILYQMCKNFHKLASDNKFGHVAKGMHRDYGDRANQWFCNAIHTKVSNKTEDLVIPIGLLNHENVSKIIREENEKERRALVKMIK